MVDFRRSLPPRVMGMQQQMPQGLHSLANAPGLEILMHESRARAEPRERLAAARFLAPRLGAEASPERVIVTNGTQSALILLLREIVGASGVLLAENLTYAALRPLARECAIRLEGVAIDEEGLLPDAFERACRTLKPRALYCNPTLHNPTTAIMSLARRWEIVEIARRHGVALIEDEALGRLYPDAPQPLATLAPEICWYLMSTTKCMSHGLRVAYLVAPSGESAQALLETAAQLSFWVPMPLGLALTTSWIESGIADRITAEIATECGERQRIASEILADFDMRAPPSAMHIWLTLPAGVRANPFVEDAQKAGVLLRPASRFSVNNDPVPECIRLSLSTPSSLAEVREGLHALRDLIARR